MVSLYYESQLLATIGITFLLSCIVVPLDSAFLASEGKALLESGWWSNCINLPSDHCRWPGNLGKLEELHLSHNNLVSSIPLEIGNLGKLKELDLGHNNLVGSIPLETSNLRKFEELDLGHNNLVGSIPLEIGNLGKLKELDLTRNNL
ncbi:unnamed protein product, partial [Dovyalis caffra]